MHQIIHCLSQPQTSLAYVFVPLDFKPLIPTVLHAKQSLVIHDPKGEIHEITGESKKKNSKVIVFDPASANSAKYNVFAKEVMPNHKDDLRSYVRNIADIVIQAPSGSHDSFFYREAQTAFTFFTLWLIHTKGSTSLPEVRKKILSQNEIEHVIIQMCPSLKTSSQEEDDASQIWGDDSNEDLPEYLLELGRAVLANTKSSKQWAAIVSTLRQALDVFESETVMSATNDDCDFTPELLRKESYTVYLKVRELDKERLSPLIAIIFSSLTRQLLSKMPNEDDYRVSFILDEFIRLGRLDSVINMPAVGRGYKFNAMFIAQDYGQISDIYSNDKLSEIESNTVMLH